MGMTPSVAAPGDTHPSDATAEESKVAIRYISTLPNYDLNIPRPLATHPVRFIGLYLRPGLQFLATSTDMGLFTIRQRFTATEIRSNST